jgi:hypothetical protein
VPHSKPIPTNLSQKQLIFSLQSKLEGIISFQVSRLIIKH